jgi:hypothetical protein
VFNRPRPAYRVAPQQPLIGVPPRALSMSNFEAASSSAVPEFSRPRRMQQLLEAADQAQRTGEWETVERYIEIIFTMLDGSCEPQ